MTTGEFVTHLQTLGISLTSAGESIRVNAPKDAFTSELRIELSRRKPEILRILEERSAPSGDPGSSITPISRSAPLPLSFSQQRLWLIDQLDPGNPAYNVPYAWKIQGDLNVPLLEKALNEVIRRHEVLRTTFQGTQDHVLQVIHHSLRVSLRLADLDAAPEPERESQLRTILMGEVGHRFDLEKGPLIRSLLVREAAQEHLLVLNLHHIVCDEWSIGLIAKEIGDSYRSLIQGRQTHLPDLAIQYADFAVWQREQLKTPGLEKQLAVWKSRLGTGITSVELPADHPRSTVHSFRGSTEKISLSQATTVQLENLGKKSGASPFMTFLAAFLVLLQRYSRQEDIVVGTPIANRNRDELQPLIGFFLNTLALRTDLSGDPTFVEVLERVRNAAIEGYENQDFPFEMIVENLRLERVGNRNPLFQVMFVHHSGDSTHLSLPGLKTESFLLPGNTAKFDLACFCTRLSQGLILGFEFSHDLYQPATIRRMLGHLAHLLEEIVRDSSQKISEIPILTEKERNQLLREWNQTASDYPSETTLQVLFEKQADRTPDSIAVEFGSQRLTYRELDGRANQIAQHLRTLGAAPGVLVGVCVERSAEMVAALLGILKTGAAYVPLDPALPAARLALMIEDTTMPLLVTQSALVSALPPHRAMIVCLDNAAFTAAAAPAPQPIAGTPDDLAYVIYTSGSTGRPKGVEIAHRGLCNLVTWQRHTFQVDEKSRVLQFASFSFDASVWEVFMALANGATLVLRSQKAGISPPDFAAFLRRTGVTHATLPPTLLAVLPAEDLPALHTVISAGEACSAEIARRWSQGRRFFNGYGPTEATICASSYLCGDESKPPPIGRPIQNTQLYILDRNLQPLPIGVPGELHIGGVGLARGYLNRPELTKEKFIPHPFANESGARLYKTGDLCRYLPDGNIEYLGRMDNQVKIRGFRIELGEIESLLKQDQAVSDAVVIAREDTPGDKRLVAYLVSAQTRQPSIAALRNHLKTRLPDYMMPAEFVFLDSIPLNTNGKVDLRALPETEGRAEPGRKYAPPQNALQTQLVEIWEEVLNRRPVGIRDDFFESGGHSLLAARVVRLIADRIGGRLSFGEFFSRPTIEEHALHLSATAAPARQTPFTPIHPAGRQTPVFFFHGDVLGGGMYCKTLAGEVGADRPFYVVHPHGLDGDEIPSTIEAMAAERLKWIRQIQPHGPYILGGYCNGALLAFQAARLLREAGEPVAVLLMLNANGSNIRFRLLQRLTAVAGALRGEDEAGQRRRFLKIRDSFCDHEALGRHYLMAAKALLKQPPRVQAARVWRKTRRILRRFVPKALRALPPGASSGAVAGPPPARHKEAIMNVYDDVCRAHIPGRYDSPVVLLWPKDEPPLSSRGPTDGWRSICAQLALIEVPGDHTTCVAQNANVVMIGEAMRKSIAQAESLLSQSSS